MELICDICERFRECKVTLFGLYICEDCQELPFYPIDKQKASE